MNPLDALPRQTAGRVASPAWALLGLFVAFKTLLLAVALLSPGPGYDTSTNLLMAAPDTSSNLLAAPDTSTNLLAALAHRLTRWDAIYFTAVARRGAYVFENEWAFGWGMTTAIRLGAQGLTGLGLARHAYTEAICAVAISHVAHLLGVWAMYGLTLALVAGPARHRVAFVAAALHVLSPGGLFLSAPYGESLASLLVLVGYVLYVGGSRGGSHGLSRDASLLAAGICFGLATSVRSNGLLNGLLFLEDALRTLVGVRKVTLSWVRRLFAIGLGGVCVGLGFAGPQYLAHRQLCRLDPATMQMSRPWCSSMFPSVYAFVQTHYWDVGLFRYWKASNIPLFLVAAPMILVWLLSGLSLCSARGRVLCVSDIWKPGGGREGNLQTERLLRSMALPQLIMAIAALGVYHVQIVNRLASAHPIWTIWLALHFTKRPRDRGDAGHQPRWHALVRVMIMYGVVQAGLFASFMPPA